MTIEALVNMIVDSKAKTIHSDSLGAINNTVNTYHARDIDVRARNLRRIERKSNWNTLDHRNIRENDLEDQAAENAITVRFMNKRDSVPSIETARLPEPDKYNTLRNLAKRDIGLTRKFEIILTRIRRGHYSNYPSDDQKRSPDGYAIKKPMVFFRKYSTQLGLNALK